MPISYLWVAAQAASLGCDTGPMIEPLQTILIGASLLLAVVAGVYVVLDRTPDNFVVGFAVVLEIGLLVQAVVGIVQVFGDAEIASRVNFVGYLLGTPLILPLGVLWSLSERSRGATGVLIVSALTTAFLIVRVIQVHG